MFQLCFNRQTLDQWQNNEHLSGHIINYIAKHVQLTQLEEAVAWWTCQITVNQWFAAHVTFAGWVVKVKRPADEGRFRQARRCTWFWGRVIHYFVIASRYVGIVSQSEFPLRGGNWKRLRPNDGFTLLFSWSLALALVTFLGKSTESPSIQVYKSTPVNCRQE